MESDVGQTSANSQLAWKSLHHDSLYIIYTSQYNDERLTKTLKEYDFVEALSENKSLKNIFYLMFRASNTITVFHIQVAFTKLISK